MCIYLGFQLPLCSNVYDEATDFEICGLHKNTKTRSLENKTLFFIQIKNSLITHTSRATLWQKLLL